MKKMFDTLVIASTLLAITESSVGMEVSEIFKLLIEVKQEDKDSINNAMKGKNFNFPTLTTKDHKGEEIDVDRDIPDLLDDEHILLDDNLLVSNLQQYIQKKDPLKSNSNSAREELRKELVQILHSQEFIHKNAGNIIQSAIDFLGSCVVEIPMHAMFQEDSDYLNSAICCLYTLCTNIKGKENYVVWYNCANVSYHILVEEKRWLDSLLAILRKLKERDLQENGSLNNFITRCEIRSSVLEVILRIYNEVAGKIDACLTENCKRTIGIWRDPNFRTKIRNEKKEAKDKNKILVYETLIPWLAEISKDILEIPNNFGIKERCIEACNEITAVVNGMSCDCMFLNSNDLLQKAVALFEIPKISRSEIENMQNAQEFLIKINDEELYDILELLTQIDDLEDEGILRIPSCEKDDEEEGNNNETSIIQIYSYRLLGDNCIKDTTSGTQKGSDLYKSMISLSIEKVTRNFIKKANTFGNAMKEKYAGSISNITFNSNPYTIFSILPDDVVIDAAYPLEFLGDSKDFEGENNFLNKIVAGDRRYSILILRTIGEERNNYLLTRIPIDNGKKISTEEKDTEKKWRDIREKRLKLLKQIGGKEGEEAFNDMMRVKSNAISKTNAVASGASKAYNAVSGVASRVFGFGLPSLPSSGDSEIAAANGEKTAKLENDIEKNKRDRQKLLDQLGGYDLEYTEFLAGKERIASLVSSFKSEEEEDITINEFDQASSKYTGDYKNYSPIFQNDPIFCLKKLVGEKECKSITKEKTKGNTTKEYLSDKDAAREYLIGSAKETTQTYHQQNRGQNTIEIELSNGEKLFILNSIPKDHSLRRLLPIWKLKIKDGADIVVSVAVTEFKPRFKPKEVRAYLVPLFGLRPSFRKETDLLAKEENAVITIAKVETLLKKIKGIGKSIGDLMQIKDILLGDDKLLNAAVDKATDLYIQGKLNKLIDEGNQAIKKQQEARQELIRLYEQGAKFMITDDMRDEEHKEFVKVNVQNLKGFIAKKAIELGLKVGKGVTEFATEFGGTAAEIASTIFGTAVETAETLPLPDISLSSNAGEGTSASSPQIPTLAYTSLTNPGMPFGMPNVRPGKSETANFCYINSTLQLLFGLPEIEKTKIFKKDSKVFSLLRKIYTNKETVEKGYEELMKISKRNFTKYSQQDAAELLEGLLANCPELNCSFEEEETFTCQNQHISRNSNTSFLFKLALNKSSDLQDMINADLKNEQVERDCKTIGCEYGANNNDSSEKKKKNKCTLQKSITAKDTLFVQIMRYDSNLQMVRRAMSIPSKVTVNGQNFAVVGIVNHVGGKSIESGHYTTLILRNGKWYECNDNTIVEKGDIFTKTTTITRKNYYDDQNGQAYIIMLKRIPEKK